MEQSFSIVQGQRLHFSYRGPLLTGVDTVVKENRSSIVGQPCKGDYDYLVNENILFPGFQTIKAFIISLRPY